MSFWHVLNIEKKIIPKFFILLSSSLYVYPRHIGQIAERERNSQISQNINQCMEGHYGQRSDTRNRRGKTINTSIFKSEDF